MLRRLKSVELSGQLPRKTEVCVYVPLTDLQARIYMRFVETIDVATALGKSRPGDLTGPLWRMNHPDMRVFPCTISPWSVLG